MRGSEQQIDSFGSANRSVFQLQLTQSQSWLIIDLQTKQSTLAIFAQLFAIIAGVRNRARLAVVIVMRSWMKLRKKEKHPQDGTELVSVPEERATTREE